jgi:hypothetical protein
MNAKTKKEKFVETYYLIMYISKFDGGVTRYDVIYG